MKPSEFDGFSLSQRSERKLYYRISNIEKQDPIILPLLIADIQTSSDKTKFTQLLKSGDLIDSKKTKG